MDTIGRTYDHACTMHALISPGTLIARSHLLQATVLQKPLNNLQKRPQQLLMDQSYTEDSRLCCIPGWKSCSTQVDGVQEIQSPL